jgi:hypothetical protein
MSDCFYEGTLGIMGNSYLIKVLKANNFVDRNHLAFICLRVLEEQLERQFEFEVVKPFL